MEEYKRNPNAVCVICGKAYYKKPSNKDSKCCSKQCKEQLFYQNGSFRLIPYCAAKKITVKDFVNKLDFMHNVEMKPMKQISEELGIVRITLMRICKKYGIRARSVSEDNYRRYSTMTQEQINAQTENAHKGIRLLFKDRAWKENQMRKVHESQNFKRSKPELLFEFMIRERGYTPIPQYTKDMAGFILDFAFPDIKLAVEIDGEYWHSLPQTKKRDRCKDYLLQKKKGWELIRIPASDFARNAKHYIWEVVQQIETLKLV